MFCLNYIFKQKDYFQKKSVKYGFESLGKKNTFFLVQTDYNNL